MLAEGHLNVRESHSAKPRGKVKPNRGLDTYIVGGSVPKDVVERFCLGHVLGRLSNDDGQLDLIIREMHLDWLGGFGDRDWCIGTDHGRERFVEQNRRTGGKCVFGNGEPTNKDTYAGFAILVSA